MEIDDRTRLGDGTFDIHLPFFVRFSDGGLSFLWLSFGQRALTPRSREGFLSPPGPHGAYETELDLEAVRRPIEPELQKPCVGSFAVRSLFHNKRSEIAPSP